MAGETAERTRVLAATSTDVWAVLGDVRRMPEWSEELEGIELVEGDGRSPGSRFRGRNRDSTHSWAMTCVIDTYDPGRSLEFHTENDKGEIRTRWWYRLQPAAGGTEVTEGFLRVAKLNAVIRAAERKLLGDRTEHNRRNIDESLRRLAALIESSASH